MQVGLSTCLWIEDMEIELNKCLTGLVNVCLRTEKMGVGLSVHLQIERMGFALRGRLHIE